MAVSANAQVLLQGEYFFDSDPGPGNGTAINFAADDSVDLVINTPIGDLTPGFHILSLRFRDGENEWGITSSRPFHVNEPQYPFVDLEFSFPLVRGEYFFDTDPGPGNGTGFFFVPGDDINTVFSITAPVLTSGTHKLGVRVLDLGYRWSVSQWQEVTFIDDPLNVWPIASFTWSPDPQPNNPVSFNSTSQNTNLNSQYQWDVDGDGVPDYNTPSMDHTFANAGVYPVELAVINDPSALAQEAEIRYYFLNGALNDLGGTCTDFSLVNTPELAEGRAGDMIGSYTLDGDRLDAQGSLSMSAMTISYWFKGSESDYSLRVVGEDGLTKYNSLLGGVHRIFTSNITAVTAGSNVEDGDWHHLVLTWDAAGPVASYFDGSPVTTQNIGVKPVIALDSLVLGGFNNFDAIGGIDDILIYDRVLSASEINELFLEAYVSLAAEMVPVGNFPSNEITLSGPTEFCSGSSINLVAPFGSNFLWNTGETSQSIEVSTSGAFHCTYIDFFGNERLSEQVEILVHQSPVVELTVFNANNGAANGSAGVEITPGEIFQLDISWSNGGTELTNPNLIAGVYSVTVTDGQCPVSIPFQVDDEPLSDLIIAAEYFFNADPGPGNGIPLVITAGAEVGTFAQISADGLPVGLHQLSVRTRESDGKWSITRTSLISIVDDLDPTANEPQPKVVHAEYFIDYNDPGPGNAIAVSIAVPDLNASFTASADLTGYSSGPHIISFRVQDSLGVWGITRTAPFFIDFEIPPTLEEIIFPVTAAEYFIGTADPGVGNATAIEIPAGNLLDVVRTIDISGLSIGIYLLNVRTKDISGKWSNTRSQYFEVDAPLCTTPVVTFDIPAGNAGDLLTFTSTSGNLEPGVTYSWDVFTDGNNESISDILNYTFPNPGTYDVMLTVNNGDVCISSLVQEVVVGPVLSVEVLADGPTAFCEGAMVQLTAPEGSSYVWSTGEESQVIDVYTSGFFQCSYIDANGNPSLSSVVEVIVYPQMQIDVLSYSATNGNSNGSAGLIVSGGNSFIYTYDWETSDTTPIIVNLASDTYTVLVSDGVCPQSIDVVVADVSLDPMEGIVAAEYFFDADPGVGNGVAIAVSQGSPIGSFADVVTTGLSAGYHLLSVRMRDHLGKWGITRTLPVYLSDPDETPYNTPAVPIVAMEYFFDTTDPGPGNGLPLTGFVEGVDVNLSTTVDLAGLTTGVHWISVRARDENGHWGITKTSTFYILPELTNNLSDNVWPIVQAECFFDSNDPGVGNGIPIPIPTGTNVSQAYSVDLSSLSLGSHRLSVRVRDIAGHWSVTHSEVFNIISLPCAVPSVSFDVPNITAGIPADIINSSTNLEPGATYEWDVLVDGIIESVSADLNYTFPSPGIYSVQLSVENSVGCESAFIEQVVVGPLYSTELVADGPTAFCDGNSVSLTAPNGSDYLWSNGETTQSILVTESGVYQCAFVDQNGNSASSNQLFVEVWPLVDVEVTSNNPTNGDSNGSIGLLVSGGNAFIYSFDWNIGSDAQILTELDPGFYSVQISDGLCPVNYDITLVDVLADDITMVVAAEYFWDMVDPGPGNGMPILVPAGETTQTFAGIATIGLDPGFHRLSVRVKDNDGKWGITKTIPVALTIDLSPQPNPLADVVHMEYFIDYVDPGPSNATQLAVSLPAPIVNESYSIDCALLSPGEHIISVRALDSDGKWSVTQTGFFNLCFPPDQPLITSGTTLYCSGESIELSSNGGGFTQYWSGPNGMSYQGDSWIIANADESMEGWYSVVAEGDPGCLSTPAMVYISIEVPPAVPSLISGPSSICVTDENGTFYIEPIDNALNYDWNFPPGAIVLSGNNSNNILCDFADASETPFNVTVTAINQCGSETSAIFILELTCIASCPGDFNNDGVINTGDLLLLLSNIGCTGGCAPFDLSGDGNVNTADLLSLLAAYGTSCP